MNGSTAHSWPDAAHFDLDSAADHDFQNLIDFDSLDLDFAIAGYDARAPDSQQLADLADSLNGHHLHTHFSPHTSPQHSQPAPNFFDYSLPQQTQSKPHVFAQGNEHVFDQHHHVPPTPNSIELHGDPHRYLQQLSSQQVLFEHTYHMPKEDASFTPLVSPAVTPHDARFQTAEFGAPGTSFSPLTSPALNAQSQHHLLQQSQNTTSGSSTGHSPAGVDTDMLNEPLGALQEQGRKLRSTNRRNPSRASNHSSRVRQSPIVKAHRRKATVSSLIPPKEVSELMHEARSRQSMSDGREALRGFGGSETDSISPEPLLSEMPPPPKPSSLTASPAIPAQYNSLPNAPATPASLMHIQPSPNFNADYVAPPLLEDLRLPEASLDRPRLSRISTATSDEDLDTPRISARKTPKLCPLSTPGASMSNRLSPNLGPTSTPTSPALSMINGRKDGKSARNPKKRNSITSTLVSPALRPKISPSMKPLLPDGGNNVADNTHALLLASKSNYQNILDGTTVPGVVYPISLSTNLTSKRTSHKIAEQGRRNRINTALLEMQALLPSPLLSAADAAKTGSDVSAQQQSSNSKAAKVESAIEYIRELKEQVSRRDALLASKEGEIEELRRELMALRKKPVAVIGEEDDGGGGVDDDAATRDRLGIAGDAGDAADET